MKKSQLKNAAARLLNLLRGAAQRSRGRVAMLHYGRCGSTVLTELLGAHSLVHWDKEVFRRMFRKTCLEAHFLSDPFWLLRARMWQTGGSYYGFEIKCHEAYHLSPPVLDMSADRLISELIGLGYRRFVILKRRNYLRQQISEEVGRQNNEWHRSAGARSRLHPITLNVEQVRFGGQTLPLLDSFAARDRGYADMKRLLQDQRVLRLTFEEDVKPDPRRGYRRMCSFLDIEPERPEIRKARTNPFSLRELLRNYDEVAAALRPTSYAWMLDE